MHAHDWRSMVISGALVGLLASSLVSAPASLAEEPTTPGNNLSFPVLWSEDGYLVAPPGEQGVVSASGEISPCSDTSGVEGEAAVQKDEGNSWQADNVLQAGNFVTEVDWGDNLEAKDWRVDQMVRIETALYAALEGDTMTGYQMCHVDGQGQTEVWGALVEGGMGGSGAEIQAVDPSLVEYESEEALVYTAGARLTIQRIADDASPTWDPVEHRWVGSGVADPVFNGAVHEKTSDGPGSYGAEINVSGKVVFGFIWDTAGLYNGEYRLTFSLDGADSATGFPGSGTSLQNAAIRVPVEESLASLVGTTTADVDMRAGRPEANEAVVAGDLNLTYIDVGLTDGEDPPVDPDPEPTDPPTTPPSGGGDVPATPPGASEGSGEPGAGPADSPENVVVPPGEGSATVVGNRIAQVADITAAKSSKRKVGTRLILTKEPVYTDWGVTVRWRVTKRSQDNCTIRNRDGEQSVKFIKRGRCTVVAWAPSPNPELVAPFKELRVYKVRNVL